MKKRATPQGGGRVSRSFGRRLDNASHSESRASFQVHSELPDPDLILRIFDAFQPMIEAGPEACIQFMIMSAGDHVGLRALLAALEMMNERGDFEGLLH